VLLSTKGWIGWPATEPRNGADRAGLRRAMVGELPMDVSAATDFNGWRRRGWSRRIAG